MLAKATLGMSALVGLAICTFLGLALTEPDTILSRIFNQALAQKIHGFAFTAPIGTQPPQRTLAGDEGFWLSRAEAELATPFIKTLAVGNRIKITSGDGRDHTLEVVDVRALGSNLTSITTAGSDHKFVLVTCKTGPEDGSRTVRFIVEDETMEAGSPVVKTPKAL
jgi:hypothetical protein